MSLDSFKCRRTLKVGAKTYTYFSLKAAEKNGLGGISRLPFSLKVLLENLLRHEDGRTVAEARGKPLHRLRSERDFRHQDDAPLAQLFGDLRGFRDRSHSRPQRPSWALL